MSMLAGFTTSIGGMKVAQSQLDVISRNIANVDTEGYTRKTAPQNSVVLAGYSSGVSMGDVQRTVNEGLLKSYLSSNSIVGNVSITNTYLGELQTNLGTPEGKNSIASNVTDLQTAFNDFAMDVASAAGRYTLLSNAETLTSRLNMLSTNIQKLRGDADLQITANVETINGLLDTLDDLNDQIVKYKVLGYDGVADLEDKRDQALRELSGYIDITYFQRESGEMVVQTTKGVMMLDRDPHYLSHNAITEASPTSGYADGAISGIYVDGEDITSKISGGELKGLIIVRDDTLSSLQSQLDELAGVIVDEVNQVHNRGTAFPNTPSELVGSRDFIASDVQRIKIENGDVRFTVFDDAGKQVATASLIGDLRFDADGETVDSLLAKVDGWLQNDVGLLQATAAVDKDGHIVINTGDSNYGISIMDEISSSAGSAQQDVTVKFDADGDGVFDRTFEGFSNFAGLNNFFSSGKNEAIYDSKVLNKDSGLGVREKITLQFSIDGDMNMGAVNVYPSDSLEDIVNKINSNVNLNSEIRASLVPNGNGYMLRINNMSGSQMEITEVPGANGTTSGFIDRIGLTPSNVGVSGSISVRDELKATPTLIASGSPEFNETSGRYQLNSSANDIANSLAKVFSENHRFGQAGSLAGTTTTLSNYASTFVGAIASSVSDSESALSYQQELNNSIATKEAEISGVDIDEELAQLIVFQKSYAACAQSFTAAKEMLDILLGMMQ